ncbi:28590_t:CDS:2, partial [Gigaspora margarita]
IQKEKKEGRRFRKRNIYGQMCDKILEIHKKLQKYGGTTIDETRKIEIQERNEIRSEYQEREKRKERGSRPDSANTKLRSIDNVESRKRNMANGREAGVDSISYPDSNMQRESNNDAKSNTEIGKYKINENGIDKREFGSIDNKSRDKSRQKNIETIGSEEKK